MTGPIIAWGGGIIKAGNGIMTLSGADTYTGITNVNGGTLAFNGAGNSLSGQVNVATSSGNSGTLVFQSNAVNNFTATGDGNFNIAYGSTVAIQPALGHAGGRYETGRLEQRIGRQRAANRWHADDYRQQLEPSVDDRRISP